MSMIDWGKAQTAEQVAAYEVEVKLAKARGEAIMYLASTDWCVIRQMELGTPIPDDIAAGRATARLAL